MSYKINILLILLSLPLFQTQKDVQAQDAQATDLYWTDARGVHTSSLPGFNETTVLPVQISTPEQLAIHYEFDKIWWSDRNTNTIWRMNYDGSEKELRVQDNIIDPTGLALDTTRTKIYWTEPDTGLIKRSDFDGSNVEVLLNLPGSIPTDISLDLSGGKMYWADGGNNYIGRANLDGSSPETFSTLNADNPRTVLFEPNEQIVYWVDLETGTLNRKNQPGSIEGALISGLDNPRGLTIDYNNGFFYWTEDSNGGTDKVVRATLNGLNVTDIVTSGLDSPHGIIYNKETNRLYWVEVGNSRLRSSTTAGTNQQNLVTSQITLPRGVDFDDENQKIYVVDRGEQRIIRVNYDRSNFEVLISSGLNNPRSIALDLVNQRMYWTDLSGSIGRANLDGSGAQLNFLGSADGVDAPRGIRVDAAGGKIYWLDDGAHTVNRANLDGSSVEVIATLGDATNIIGLSLDLVNDKVYWTDGEVNVIRRSNLDGSGRESFGIGGAGSLRGVAVDPIAGRLYITDDGNKTLISSNLTGNSITTLKNDGIENIHTVGLVFPPPAANTAPTALGISPVNVNEDAPPTAINLYDIFNDAEDNDAQLNLEIRSNSNSNLFSNASIASGSLNLAYAEDANGSSSLTIRATDTGGLWVEASFTVTVTAVNDPPMFDAGGDQAIVENAPAQSIPNWATSISPGPANESGQTVSFNITANTNAALFSAGPAVSSNGTLTFTPAADAFGEATITLVAMDNGGTENGGVNTSAPQQFNITVTESNQNTPPSSSGFISILALEDAEDITVDLFPIFSDPQDTDEELSFSIQSNSNPNVISARIEGDQNLILSLEPDSIGSATVVIRATDTEGAFIDDDQVIMLAQVNDPPSFTKGSDLVVAQDAPPQETAGWATNISAGPPNESDQSLTFEIDSNTNPGIFSTGPALSSDGTLSFTPATGQSGTATIGVSLVDDGGTDSGGNDRSPVQTFTITINEAGGNLPVATTGNATMVRVKTAQLNAAIEPADNQVTIGFQYGTDTSYGTTIEANPASGSGTGSISASALIGNLEPETQYHYRVAVQSDAGTVFGEDQVFTTASYPATISVVQNKSFGDFSLESSFRLVSLPGETGIAIGATFSGTAGVDWNAFNDNGNATGEFFVPYDGSGTFSFRPGNGFWVVSNGNWSVNEDVASVELSNAGAFEIELQSGWNIVSTPFELATPWAAVRLLSPGINAADMLWGFNGSFSSVSTMNPYEAYYYFNDSSDPLTMRIPYPAEAAANLNIDTLPGAMLTLSTETEAGLASSAHILINEEASEEDDVFDQRSPRTQLASLALYLTPKEQDSRGALALEARPFVGKGQAFDMVLQGKAGQQLTLSTEGLEQFADYEVYLVDRRRGQFMDLHSEGAIRIDQESLEQRYSLVIGTPGFIESQRESLVPEQLELTPSYPNPFREATTIAYTLPEPASVTLEIYDLLGRRIASLVDGEQAAGFHEVTWAGAQASGVYLSVLKVGNTVQTQKLVQVR